MATKDNKTANSVPTEGKKAKKKRGLLRRLSTLLLVLVIALTAAVLSTMEDGNQFSALRRWLMYGESRETQDLFTYPSHQGNRCEPLGDDLLVVNPNSIRLLHQNGTVIFELQTNMNAPVISVGTKLAAVCDAGGNTVYVLDNTGMLWTHNAAEGLLCYSARVNAADTVTITEQKNGYKSSVTTYNKVGTQIFRFDSHDNYLCDAAATDDQSKLVTISMEARGGVFTSNLVIFDMVTAERINAHPIRDGLVVDFVLNGNSIVTLCDKRLAITTMDGETVLNYAYGERYLHDYALNGKDFCALLMGRYRSSNICQLTTFGLDGEEIAALDLTEEVLDMCVAGEYLAVLYHDSLVIYDRTLTETARLEGTDYAAHVRMSKNGTALLVAETSAWRFLP